MKINVVSFGMLKDWFPPQFEVDIEPGQTVKSTWQYLKKQYQIENNQVDTIRFAFDDCFVNEDDVLEENTTLYLMPPSSGG